MTSNKYQLFTDSSTSDTYKSNTYNPANRLKGKIRLLSPIGGDLPDKNFDHVKNIKVDVVQANNECLSIRQIFIYDSIILTINYISIDDLGINNSDIDKKDIDKKDNKIFLLINNGTKTQQKICRERLNLVCTTKVFELPCIPYDIHFFKNYVYLFARIFISAGSSSQKK